MTKFQAISATLRSSMTWLIRRPGRIVWGAIGALAVVAALAFAAQGLPGRSDGPGPGPVARIGGYRSAGTSSPGRASDGVEPHPDASGGAPAASEPEGDGHDQDATADADHDEGGQAADTEDAGGDND
jgi:hypothetical protein